MEVEGSPSQEGLLNGLEYTISQLISIWLVDTVMDYFNLNQIWFCTDVLHKRMFRNSNTVVISPNIMGSRYEGLKGNVTF